MNYKIIYKDYDFYRSPFSISWEQCKFEKWFEERNERSGDGELISVTINSGIKKFNELNRFDSKPSDMSKYKVVKINDIAYNSMRMWQGASGLSPYNGILSPAYTVITPKENVCSSFFAYLIKKPELIHQFEINSQGLTKDTWNLKFPAFSQIEAKAPQKYTEQFKISQVFNKIDNLITLHQRKQKWEFHQKSHKNYAKKLTISWEQCKFENIFNYERPDAYIVKSDKYSDTYKTPVLTANKGFILGYTDETNTHHNPCIIFDDFTLDSKYVTFDFMVKSSAMKILNVKNGYDLRFAYERLNSEKLENLGHARHYISVVQPTETLVPKIAEQEKISKLFNYLEDNITLHQCKYFYGFNKYVRKNTPLKSHKITTTWEQCKLNKYLISSYETNESLTYSKEDVLSVSGEVGVVNQIEFQGRSFAGQSVAPYGIVLTGDVIYTKSPLSTNPYGIIKTNKGKPGIVSTLYAIYHPTKLTNSNFVQFYFEDNARMNNYIRPLVNKGAKNDMKVTSDNALKGLVIFPQKDEQAKISIIFESLDNLITLHLRL